MAFKSSRLAQRSQPLGEINMIPLIDVMLVLLIVFMVTAPLLTHAVRIELPRASSQPNRASPKDVRLGIRESGEYLWNGEPVSPEGLGELLRAAAAEVPQPGVQIHADAGTPYRTIVKTMALASGLGFSKFGFVSDPERSPRR